MSELSKNTIAHEARGGIAAQPVITTVNTYPCNDHICVEEWGPHWHEMPAGAHLNEGPVEGTWSTPPPPSVEKFIAAGGTLGDQSQKKDGGKDRWSLLPWKGVRWIVKVLGFGAKKYKPGGWRTVDNAVERYGDAAARHLAAYLDGEIIDPESGLPHLAHMSCCAIFLLELDPRHQEDK